LAKLLQFPAVHVIINTYISLKHSLSLKHNAVLSHTIGYKNHNDCSCPLHCWLSTYRKKPVKIQLQESVKISSKIFGVYVKVLPYSQAATAILVLGDSLSLLTARPTVTFWATEHHCCTRLQCFATEAHRC